MMVSSLDLPTAELCKLAEELNDLTNRLNARLRSLEDELREAGVGVELWLDKPIHFVNAEGQEEGFYLAWTKTTDWGFHWASETPFGAGDEVRPLRTAPRAIRAAAFPHLDTLIRRLTAAVKSALKQLYAVRDDLPLSGNREEEL
jgi:hypothetical protein